MDTNIRVECVNNSDARSFHVLDAVRSARVRHNGGKVVVVTCSLEDVAAVEAILEASAKVASYRTAEGGAL